MSRLSYLVIVLALAAIGTGVYLWLRPPAQTAPEAQAPVPEVAQPVIPPPPEPPQPPAVQYPVEPSAPEAPAAQAGAPDVTVALTNLLGRDTVLAFFNLDHFFERAVATVDNLGRGHAAPAMWPVNPAGGRFTTDGQPPGETISAANYARYKRFVAMLAGADTNQLVALYKQSYPQFQKAYEALGYPHGYFNDRLVAVIDVLLATPEPGEPIAVNLPPVEGPVKLQRPWVRYEFSGEDLEDLTAGQKILLRMGPENRKAVKAKLADFRRKITQLGGAGQAPAPRPAQP